MKAEVEEVAELAKTRRDRDRLEVRVLFAIRDSSSRPRRLATRTSWCGADFMDATAPTLIHFCTLPQLANRQLKETVHRLETENDSMAAKLVEMTIKLSEALEEAERLRAIADDDIETRM